MPAPPQQSALPAPVVAGALPPPQPQPMRNYDTKMPKTRGRCVSAICVSWKVFTCICSHVLLVTTVVAYCLVGAKSFEYLERENEIAVSLTAAVYGAA